MFVVDCLYKEWALETLESVNLIQQKTLLSTYPPLWGVLFPSGPVDYKQRDKRADGLKEGFGGA